jgi:glycosyltransferase involved in cell wall biosynthesis
MHLISLIIPTHNRAAGLRAAIAGALALPDEGFDLEILVVDDGSSGEAAELCRHYPVRYVRAAGHGAAAARNTGMDAARGDLLTFLDDDDRLLPAGMAARVALLDAHPEYGAVYAQAQLVDPHGVPYGSPVPDMVLPQGWIQRDLLTFWPQIGTILVRTEVARAAGGMDSSLHSEEEWDWILRIAGRSQIGAVRAPVLLFQQRDHTDDLLAWHRYPDTMRVFRRYARRRPTGEWLGLVRVYWRHRGWYAGILAQHARDYLRHGEVRPAVRCVRHAFRLSPLHAVRVWL